MDIDLSPRKHWRLEEIKQLTCYGCTNPMSVKYRNYPGGGVAVRCDDCSNEVWFINRFLPWTRFKFISMVMHFSPNTLFVTKNYYILYGGPSIYHKFDRKSLKNPNSLSEIVYHIEKLLLLA